MHAYAPECARMCRGGFVFQRREIGDTKGHPGTVGDILDWTAGTLGDTAARRKEEVEPPRTPRTPRKNEGEENALFLSSLTFVACLAIHRFIARESRPLSLPPRCAFVMTTAPRCLGVH